MWKIKQIFDGDYGCEELQPGQKPKVCEFYSRNQQCIKEKCPFYPD